MKHIVIKEKIEESNVGYFIYINKLYYVGDLLFFRDFKLVINTFLKTFQCLKFDHCAIFLIARYEIKTIAIDTF